jgi:deoxyadenosine/deoxycytidine kinase
MKIAICGSHGVGKTTLAKAIAQKLKFNLIPDVVRMPGGAFDKGFPVDEATLPETQFWILSKQLEFERNAKQPWVSDKSLYDNIVYGEATFKDKRVIELIKEIVFRNAKYDLIIYLVPAFPYMHEDKRSTDPKFHEQIHKAFKKFFKEKKISYIEIKEVDFKKRLKKAIKIIKKLQ